MAICYRCLAELIGWPLNSQSQFILILAVITRQTETSNISFFLCEVGRYDCLKGTLGYTPTTYINSHPMGIWSRNFYGPLIIIIIIIIIIIKQALKAQTSRKRMSQMRCTDAATEK